jgi:ribosomal protein S8
MLLLLAEARCPDFLTTIGIIIVEAEKGVMVELSLL